MQPQVCARPKQALLLERATPVVVWAGINLLQLNVERFLKNTDIVLEQLVVSLKQKPTFILLQETQVQDANKLKIA